MLRRMAKPSHPVMAAVYDAIMAPQDWFGLRKQRLRLAAAATGRVVEVGAGTGWNLPLYRNAAEVVAVEPDPHMLRRARKRVGKSPAPTRLVEADGQDLPFGDGEFDSAVVSLSLCTIPDPAAALAEIHRVLRPGGTLVFLEHTRSPKPRAARLQDRVTPVWRRVAGGCHPNRPSVDTIRDAGFEVAKLWRSGKGKGVIVQGAAHKSGTSGPRTSPGPAPSR
jgi:ubiquinone/menaquinone biosynthesis C-methylase UbiE